MRVKFSIKAFYILLIAFVVSFIYAVLEVMFLADLIPDDSTMLMVGTSTFAICGLVLIIGEKWLHIFEPNANTSFLIPVRNFGLLFIAASTLLFGKMTLDNGLTTSISAVFGFTVLSALVLVVMYLYRKRSMRRK